MGTTITATSGQPRRENYYSCPHVTRCHAGSVIREIGLLLPLLADTAHKATQLPRLGDRVANGDYVRY